jgi:hypothetical protein
MGAEEEVDSSALCPMDPGDREFIAVLVEPCARFRVLQIDIDRAELLRDDAYKCIGPAFPPGADHCLIGAGVLKAPESQRRLMLCGIGGDVLTRERGNVIAGEPASMVERGFPPSIRLHRS